MKISDVIKDRDHWCQGNHAQDAKGCNVSPRWPEAKRFCLKGAIIRLKPYAFTLECYRLELIIKRLYPERTKFQECPIVSFNDHEETQWWQVNQVIKEFDTNG